MNFQQLLQLLKRKPQPKTRSALGESYSNLLARLSEIRRNYDFVEDEHAVDSLIFEENAVVKQLESIIREARAQGLSLDFYELPDNDKSG